MSARAVVVSPQPGVTTGGTERLCDDIAGLMGRLGYAVSVVGPRPAPGWMARQGLGFAWAAHDTRRAARAAGAAAAEVVVTAGFLGWPGRSSSTRIHIYAGNIVRQAAHIAGRVDWRARWGVGGGVVEALAARGAVVVAASEQAAEDARRLYRARVTAVLHPGVDTARFRPRPRIEARRRLGLRPDGRYALFVGRAEPGKGPHVAVAASHAAGFELMSAGHPPPGGSVALGRLPVESLAWAYNAADVVVMPTRYEGFGYVAVEAVLSGVPVVTTPTGWARELARAVPAYRPFLVPPEPTAVAAAIRAIDCGDHRAAWAAARVLAVEQCSLDAFARRWVALLERACAPVPRKLPELA